VDRFAPARPKLLLGGKANSAGPRAPPRRWPEQIRRSPRLPPATALDAAVVVRGKGRVGGRDEEMGEQGSGAGALD
jgi:hypothetical protein